MDLKNPRTDRSNIRDEEPERAFIRTDKRKFHKLGLHEPPAELAKVIRPHLTIVDAVEGMEGEDRLNGKKKKGERF